MSILSIEIPQEVEIIKESIIPENSTLLYTHIPTIDDIQNNLPIFQIYESDGSKLLVTLDYKDGHYSYNHSQILENVIGTEASAIIIGLNDNKPISAKIDTGADLCSLNVKNIKAENEQVSFDFHNRRYRMNLASNHNIKTADGGSELRPSVKLSMKIKNTPVNDIMVTLNDRGNLSDLLIGMNCIKSLDMKIDPNLKEYVDASMKLLEYWDEEDGEDDEDLSHLLSIKVAESLTMNMANAAQKIYDKWDESDVDTYANGGICHYIADAICEILNGHNIDCATVSASHEQHVYTVARFVEGVYSIDIHHSNYETGGGFSWKKIPDVEFTPRDIGFYCISRNPSDYHQSISDY